MLMLYGDKFAETGPVFQFLSPLILTAAIYSLLGQCLEILGEQRKAMRIYAVSAVINVAGNLVLVPHFGKFGSAAATVISSLYTAAMLFYAMKRNAHVKLYTDGIGRAVVFLIIIALLYIPLSLIHAALALPLGALIFAALLLPFRKYWLEGMGRVAGPLNALFK